jgi:hypothetical protein
MPERITEEELKQMRQEALDQRGLYGKFIVFKADASGTHIEPNSKPLTDVFVLRPERDVHAREALRAYARSSSYEQSTRRLAHDLFAWLDAIEQKEK